MINESEPDEADVNRNRVIPLKRNGEDLIEFVVGENVYSADRIGNFGRIVRLRKATAKDLETVLP